MPIFLVFIALRAQGWANLGTSKCVCACVCVERERERERERENVREGGRESEREREIRSDKGMRGREGGR